MADFKKSIGKVLAHEGGYVNDPNDAGGETYKGIARNMWKDWAGWAIIDAERHVAGFPKNLLAIVHLGELIADFYKKHFWDKIGGDQLKNQDIADLLVDIAVNQGVVPAVKRAQEVVGQEQTGHIDIGLIASLNSLA